MLVRSPSVIYKPDIVAGLLHSYFRDWIDIARCVPFEGASEVIVWLRNRADITKYFKLFKGSFQGTYYGSNAPSFESGLS